MALVNTHWLLRALLFTGLGMIAGVYFADELTTATISAKRAAVNSVVSATALDARAAVILEYPELLPAIRAKGTVAEGESHPAISQNAVGSRVLRAQQHRLRPRAGGRRGDGHAEPRGLGVEHIHLPVPHIIQSPGVGLQRIFVSQRLESASRKRALTV